MKKGLKINIKKIIFINLMALFEHTSKSVEILPNLKKQKQLSKTFGTDFFLNKVRSLSGHELGNFRTGAMFLGLIFGGMSYYFYRQYNTQKFMSSAAYYKLVNLNPLDAGNQFWFHGRVAEETDLMTLYYRMPRKEFDVKYRMRSAYIRGEFDHDKEILIPRKENGQDGYDVITPFYYYRKLSPNEFLSLHSDGSPFQGYTSERAGIAVFRGWVPAALKDRRLRPHDINKGEKETLNGTIKLSTVNKHDFTHPNDPTYNLWVNYSLQDFAHFWNLPNIRDAQHCYFQEINFGSLGFEKKDVFPVRPTLEMAIVEDGKDQGLKLDRNYKGLSQYSAGLATFFSYLLYLAC